MKKLLVTIFATFTMMTVAAQSPQQLMQQGNEAYSHGNYDAAAEAYNAILEGGAHSADLYYNLGNAYYRMDEIGLAILNYERALRLNPHFRDAQQNLDLAYSKTEDKIDALPKIFLTQWAEAVVSWFSPSGWLVVVLVLVTVLVVLVVVFFISGDYAWRRRTLLLSIVVMLLMLIAIGCSISSHIRYNRHDRAIITSPMIVMKSSPDTNSIDKMILHEGTPVNIEETIDEWHKIHIADGTTGWVEDSDITII